LRASNRRLVGVHEESDMLKFFRQDGSNEDKDDTKKRASVLERDVSSPPERQEHGTDDLSESAQRSRVLFGLIVGSMVALWGRRHRPNPNMEKRPASNGSGRERQSRCSALVSAAPVIRMGLVADVQYADKDDKEVSGSTRHYRNAIHKLARIVEAFDSEAGSLDLVLQLGDLVDGQEQLDGSRADLELVLGQFARLPVPLYHVLGNHCLKCGRDWLLKRLRTRAFYDMPLRARMSSGPSATSTPSETPWRLVVLDCLDISLHWDDPEDPRRLQAKRYLKEHASTAPNAVPYNGGIGETQLVWLENVLAEARTRQEFVIVAGHVPIAPQSAAPSLLLWNYEEVMALFRVYRDVVKLVLAGHEHDGGYAQVDGIHYITLHGVVNCTDGDDNAYAILELVGHSFARLHGFGRVESRLLLFDASP